MAGRVERRINDKFYFVLDEVGGSSDLEAEFASEVDDKTSKISKPNEIFSSDCDSTLLKNKTTINDLAETNVETNNFNGQKNLQSPYLTNLRNEENGSSDSNNSKDNYLNIGISEDSSAVIDMDIDSNLESPESSTKPLLRLTFRDEDVEKHLKPSFLKFVSQQFKNCTVVTNSENSLEIEVYDKDPRELLEDVLDFDLDTTPGDRNLEIPDYGKVHDVILSDKSLDKKPDSGKLHASANSCFNCLGSHNMKDCPKPRDQRTINMNRMKFQNKKEKLSKSSRYHLDENQKFSHLVPGVISKKLRNALNLKKDELPSFIYRMRKFGYPPGWLEEAKVHHSGVVLYDDTGVPILEEDEEEGEIIPEGAKDKYDVTKIIEFPGFNVPLPDGVKDDSRFYDCPALSDDQSKETLIKQLEPKTVQAYVKKSLKTLKSDDKTPTENKRPGSPTIEEMEEKKRQLLLELKNEETAFDTKTPSDDSSMCPTPTSSESSSREVGTVKNLEFGTPVLKSVSPYAKLPSREQFSCNVSDVINFENLPNSTGKYETMREVISKIRVSVSKSKKE